MSRLSGSQRLSVTLHTVHSRKRHVLANLAHLYVYDASDIAGIDCDEEGAFQLDTISEDRFWSEADHHPFFVRVDGRLAGFAMVDNQGNAPITDRNIADFFILRKYRRKRVGASVACALFDRFPDAVILDQRLLWLFPLAYLVIYGPGLISVDGLAGRILCRR